MALVVKKLPANARDIRDTDSIPWSKGSSGGGCGNPLECSCLENPMDRGAWQVAFHRVAQSQTWLKQLSMNTCIGERKGNPLQHSFLENARDRGA